MPDALHKKFGKRLRQLRLDRALTQERLAEKAGLSVDAIRRLERVGFSPTLVTLAAISRGLGVALHELLQFGDGRLSDKEVRLMALLAGRKESDLALILRLAQAVFSEADG